jgi:hypothetical protein|tara:strand:- start:1536 stop:1778 length:243 start_codon:yes stop_codon:yes gene_type:complete
MADLKFTTAGEYIEDQDEAAAGYEAYSTPKSPSTIEFEAICKSDMQMVNDLRHIGLVHIADRLEQLTSKAHNRLHWTGAE